MKSIPIILCLICVLFGLNPAYANRAEAISAFRNAIAKEKLEYGVERPAQLAENQLPVIEAIRKLMEKLPDSSKPVSELMTTQQASEFGELRQKQLYFGLQRLLYSKRERDLEVVEKLVFLAEQEYQWGRAPSKDEHDYKYYELLRVLQSKEINSEEYAVSMSPPLDGISQVLLGELIKSGPSELEPLKSDLEAFIKFLKGKYKVDEVKEDLLSAQEKADGNLKLTRYKACSSYYESLLRIQLYYTIATKVSELGLKDVSESGGDPSAIGKSIQAFAAEHYTTPGLNFICDFTTLVNEKIPCSAVKDEGNIADLSNNLENRTRH